MPRVRNYIFVPFHQKDEAKQLGALWDNKAKKFYVPQSLDKNIFAKWQNPNPQMQKIDENEAIEQFKIKLQSQNLIVDGPIMDGKLHRCQVVGDKDKETSGAYVGFLDEYPAGYIENFKMGIKINWKFERGEVIKNPNVKSTSSTPKLKSTNKQKNQKREVELIKLQEKTAHRLQVEWDSSPQAPNNHPYLLNKKINVNNLKLVKLDKFGNLLIPLKDINGKLWSLQRIGKNGKKLIGVIKTKQEIKDNVEFAAKKKGCFYTETPIDSHKIFQICEGFATTISIQHITQNPTIMAVDSGNLLNVCDELISKYPNKNIIIFADNDLKKALVNKNNVGLNSALKCKEKYPKIQVIYPQIDPKEAEIITDFNDMLIQKGIEVTKSNIEKQKI